MAFHERISICCKLSYRSKLPDAANSGVDDLVDDAVMLISPCLDAVWTLYGHYTAHTS